ncbi:MAG: radical SAM protein [bacterium]
MKKGKVILFYPGYENSDYHWFPFPYLYIGPFLEREGFTPIIIDARTEPNWKSLLKDSLGNALCLGVTSMTSADIRDALDAAVIGKESNPKLPVVWGGPHATAKPEETVEPGCVDIAVRGPGENVMTEIANRAYYGRDLTDISGTTYKKEGTIYNNGNPDTISFDYDIFPAFHLIDVEKYRSPNNVVSIFTARGCPYRCTFCTTGDKAYSERTLKQVKEEILYVVNELRFKNIFFQDGTFFVKKNRVVEIARWLVESGLKIKWKAKARANSLLSYSEEELSELKESGLVSVFFGIESGSLRVLENMRKKTKPQDAEESAEICRNYEIEFYASFMFATPYETVDDLKNTLGHIKRLKEINPKAIIQNCIYLPLPGTPMYEQACSNGYIPPAKLEDWIGRNISSRFQERSDITWIPPEILKEYIKIYNEEFGYYKHLCEKEKDGEYKSVFHETE